MLRMDLKIDTENVNRSDNWKNHARDTLYKLLEYLNSPGIFQ